MATIVTRSGKGSPLTNVEVDGNFTNLNTELGTKANTSSLATVATSGAYADLTGKPTISSADGSVVVTGTTNIDLSVGVAGATSNVLLPIRNTTGATLTKGTAVYISGATGQLSTVSKAIANSDATSAQTLGLITADIANNSNGNVTLIGTITNINTSAYTDGQQLYLSPTTAGTLTATKPSAPQHLVYMAVVEHAHPSQGKLFVKVQNGYEMDELHDVSAQNPSNNDGLFYNTTSGLWENKSIVTALGYTPYNATNPAGYITSVGSISGNAATATNISNTGTVTLASATESNSIYATAPSYGFDQPVKLLNFDWYSNVFSLGNIRSGDTPSNGFGFYYTASGGSRTEIARFTPSGNFGVGRSPQGKFDISAGAAGAVSYFYGGSSIVYSDIDTHVWRTAAGAERMRIDSSGIVTAATAFNAPVFTDSTNSAYYVDPYGTSNITGLTVANTITGSVSGTSGSISGFNNPTTAPTANTIVYRDSIGDIAAREIILSSGLSTATPTVLVSMFPTTNQLVRTTPTAVAAAIQGAASGIWNIRSADLHQARYVNTDFNTLGSTSQVFRAYTNYIPSGGSYNQPTSAGDFKVLQWGDVEGGTGGSGNWAGQIVQNFYDDRMWFRRSYGTTWQAWREFIHDGNYTNYAMPSGASATNSVDVRAPIFYDSNNTAYFTNPNGRSRLASMDYGDGGYYFAGGDWGYRHNTPYGWIQFGPANSGHAHIYTDRSNFYFNAQIQVLGGSQINQSDIRSPIYYDSNDTTYYFDGNGGTRQSKFLTINGNTSGIDGNELVVGNTAVTYSMRDTNLRPIIQAHGAYPVLSLNHTITSNTLHGPTVQFTANGTGKQFVIGMNGNGTQLDIGNSAATDMNPHNGIGGYNGITGWRMDGAGNVYNLISSRSPIYYDNDNTGYYSDPNGNSRLATVNADEVYSYGWLRNHESGEGVYNQATGQHFFSDSTQGWNIAGGGGNAWLRLRGSYSGAVMGYLYAESNNNIGFLNNNGTWRARVVEGDYFLVEGSSARAPIFYDSQNTGYYVDPNSVTRLNKLTAGERSLVGYATISMAGLDANTYYPVTIPLPISRQTTLRIENGLNSNAPSWSTHPAGFSCYIEWTTNGLGWGTIGVSRRVTDWREQFASVQIVGGITQLGNGSTEVIWLRGGANYFFSADCDVTPTIQTTTYTLHGQSVEPRSSIFNNPREASTGRFAVGSLQTNEQSLFRGNIDISTGSPQIVFTSTTSGRAASFGMTDAYNMYLNAPSGGALFLSEPRASIVYDSNDTSYYVDPNSTSVLNAINAWGEVGSRRNDVQSILRSYNLSAGGPLQFYLDHNYGNVNIGNSRGVVFAGGSYWEIANSVRAPLFYDSNDTGYYVDPNSTSRLSVANVNFLSLLNDEGLNVKGIRGQFAAGSDGQGISLFSNVDIGYPSGWGSGLGNTPSRGLSVYGGLRVAYSGTGFVTSDTSVRSPIFYDSNDTGYYIDPTSTSFTNIMRADKYHSLYGGGQASPRWDCSFYVLQSQHWYSHNGASTMYVGESGDFVYIRGYTTADVSSRAPIFYDNNNTGYYWNFADSAVSNINTVIYGLAYFASNRNTSSSSPPLQAYSNDGGGAIMSFHRGGYYAINMGLDSDNIFRIGGWSASNNLFQMDTAGNLTMAGNVTAYSDARLKKDVKTITGALDTVGKMRGVTYTRIDTDKAGVGVIAQEMLEVMPQVVHQGVGDDDTLSVAYGNLVGVLIEAIKELRNEVTTLKTTLN